jgi:hypothetical protein
VGDPHCVATTCDYRAFLRLIGCCRPKPNAALDRNTAEEPRPSRRQTAVQMHPALHKRVQANPAARSAAVDVSFDDVAATEIP